MERTEVLDMMGELKLFGMKGAYDETLTTAIKRKHEPQRFVGDLLKAEISEKQARSIRYQLTIAKLPLAKDVDDFAFNGTPINESLVRDLAGGNFIAQQRNLVLVGGTGTGKTHLAIAIARSCIRAGSRGRFFNTVDLVNRLEAEGRAGRQGRLADYLTRLDFVVLDELGYLPFAQAGGQLLFHTVSRLYERTSPSQSSLAHLARLDKARTERGRLPAGPAPALAQLRHRAATDRQGSDGRAVQRLPVVVHADHPRPVRQGSRAFGDAHGTPHMLIRDIIARMRHDGCGGRAGKVELITGIASKDHGAHPANGSAQRACTHPSGPKPMAGCPNRRSMAQTTADTLLPLHLGCPSSRRRQPFFCGSSRIEGG